MAKFKLNYTQLPIKAHFFFFMAAMGPILPFLPVYGKQLGVSPLVMGSITAVLPLLFLISKPSFGLLVDHFQTWRKIIFMALLATTSAAYIFLYFLPPLPGPVLPVDGFRQVPCSTIDTCKVNQKIEEHETCSSGRTTNCLWQCSDGSNFTQSIYFRGDHKGELSRDSVCLSMNKSYDDDPGKNEFADSRNSSDFKNQTTNFCGISDSANVCNVMCKDFETPDYCLYTSFTFWAFVLLMSVGNIGFNVSNCISDAICFDVLGDSGQMGYGRQRVWGTIGFGITALVSGYAVDAWSQGAIKIYTPAFFLVFIFTIIDLLCCSKLELPKMSGSENIVKDVYKLLRLKPIAIFLCFATVAGIMDSFIIYFLFWHVEDLAATTGDMGQIKFIEGLIIAAETLGGEVIFFSLAGKILKKIGYGYSFVFCFFCYSLRMTLISLAPTPWWIFSIELFMQGPSYALCYTTIVAYASAISPPGTSATVQGIVAGMDDGLGFAFGSLIGGILYKRVGGSRTLQIYAVLAAASSVAYFLLHVLYLKHVTPETNNRENIKYKSPRDAASIARVDEKELQVL